MVGDFHTYHCESTLLDSFTTAGLMLRQEGLKGVIDWMDITNISADCIKKIFPALIKQAPRVQLALLYDPNNEALEPAIAELQNTVSSTNLELVSSAPGSDTRDSGSKTTPPATN